MDDSEEPLLSLPPRPSRSKRWASVTLGLLAGGAIAGGGVGLWLLKNATSPPRSWPPRYEVSYTIAFPETLTTQSQLLTYSLVAYRDEPAGLQKVVRDKVETVLEVIPNRTMYQRFPRVDAYDCWAVSLGGGKGPTLQGAAPAPPPRTTRTATGSPLLPPDFVVLGGEEEEEEGDGPPPPKLSVILPDLSDGTWRYNRTASSLSFLEKCRKVSSSSSASASSSSPSSASASASSASRTSVGEEVASRAASSLSSPSNRKHSRHRSAAIKPVAFSKTLRAAAPGGRYGSYAARWTFWIDASTGAPLRLEAAAKNLWTGGHYDLTVAEFSGWRPGAVPEGAFEVPPGCPLGPAPDPRGGDDERSPPLPLPLRRRGGGGGGGGAAVGAPPLPTDFLSLALPNRHSGHAPYDQHLHSVTASGLMRSRRTRSRGEYRRRAEAFERSLRLVEAHNADPSSTYRLAINHLADLLPHEKRHGGGLIARHPRADSAPSFSSRKEEEKSSFAAAAAAVGKTSSSSPSSFLDSLHEPSRPFNSLPATVDWRGSLADSPVKDQAMCGSCWAFGTVGSLEAAVFRETGKQILLSEQQLVDCAWSDPGYKGKYPNAGCYGGYQTTAFDWYFSRGSAASQKSYPYRGVNNFCDTSVADAVGFDKAGSSKEGEAATGFTRNKQDDEKHSQTSRYVWVAGGADGLREALLTKGPMTVSVDASPDDFALYSSGIYNNSKCEEKLSRLDHAVVVSGYGEDFETKQKFWIVKNTWSVRWGEEGYVRIAISPDDCGISSQPLYLELGGVREL